MLRPAEMTRVQLLILERDVRAVTEALGRLGVVHLSEATAADGGDLVTPTDLRGQLGRIHSLLERVALLCDALEIAEDYPADEVPYASPDELEGLLEPIEERLGEVLQRRKRLDGELETEYQVLRDLEAFRPVEVPADELRDLAFLHFAIGTIPSGEVADVREEVGDRVVLLPFRSPGGQQRLVALTGRTGRFALDSILEQHGFQPEHLPVRYRGVPSDIARKSQQRLLALATEQEAIRRETRALAEEVGGRLAAWRQRLRVDEQLLAAQAYFGHTGSTCLISGYVPSVRVDAMREELLRVTGGRIVAEVTDPPEDDPDIPTLMQNPKLLKPFELLVAGYGYPGYREIEPTPLVAVSFLLMFGLMFGDIGHGLVLALGGLGLSRRVREEKLKHFGWLLLMAGCSAMVFGWIGGSFFGVEGALKPPVGGWFVPMEGRNVQRLLVTTIALGVVIITVGIVLNLINRIRARDWFGLVVDRFGLVGFIFYWGALGLGIRTLVLGGARPEAWEIGLLVVLPLAVLLFREPLHYLLTREETAHRPSLFGGLAEGFVDILETVSAYVANTVSFVRVGAFALAHAAVCVAIFATERIVRTMPGGLLWSVLVVVAGNAFVILLEGLVVSIQAMRLEYYEFFSKFFRGQGKAYHPFRIADSRTSRRRGTAAAEKSS